MIAGTERTCGLLPPDEVHTSDGTAGRLTTDRLTSATKGARLGDTAPVRRIEVFLPSRQKDHELCIRFAYVKARKLARLGRNLHRYAVYVQFEER